MTSAPLIDRLRERGVRQREVRLGEHCTTCPQCSATRKKKSDPCLSVRIEADRAIWNCHHCGWCGAVHDHDDDFIHERRRKLPPPPPSDPDERDLWRRQKAREIFFETVDPRGTLAETYLAEERGLRDVIDDTLALTTRFHPSCPFGAGRDAFRAPAIVCALRDLRGLMGGCQELGNLEDVERRVLRDSNRILAIQRLQLSSDGKKIGRGMSLGPMGDAVILCCRLWDIFYTSHICIAEGLETALTMRAMGHEGAVALGGSGRFKGRGLPFHIARVTISGERDNASESGWRLAGERWAREGRDVDVWLPPEGVKDANDVVRPRRAS